MARLDALVKKEFRFYLNSAVAYGVAVFFLVFTTVWFFKGSQFMAKGVASMRDYFSVIPQIFAWLLPALTMRSWAEERRSGTHELLLTMPYSIAELVLAKFLSAFILVLGILVCTVPLVLTLLPLGDFDLGIIFTQYLGIILLASAGLSLGIYLSSLSKNQVMAFLGSLAVLLAFTWMDTLTRVAVMPDFLGSFLTFFSLSYHYESFAKGLLDTRDIIFFLGFTALFLFLNERRLVLKKWS